MIKPILLLLSGLMNISVSFCQSHHFGMEGGRVSFRSETPVATIVAENRQPLGFFDGNNGAVYAELRMEDFSFPLPLMQEHFNNDFVHSDQFPTASFTGNIPVGDLPPDGNFSGKKPVKVEGWLTFHGITRKLALIVQLEERAGQLTARAEFPISLADFGVEVPSILMVKISPIVQVGLELVFRSSPQASATKQNALPAEKER